MQKEYLKELATQFRNAIEKAKDEGAFDTDITFNRFPRGCCGDASDLLGEFLLENGIESNYVCGNRYYDDPEEGSQSHAWLVVDGLIVDITGDQFKDRSSYYNYSEIAYVGTGDAFHDLFVVEDRDIHKTVHIEELGDFCYPRLKSLYQYIKKHINRG